MNNKNFFSAHSVYLNQYNTMEDFHLFPEARPYVAPPTPRTDFVDVTGMDGVLDYTDVLVKWPVYDDIEGDWKFKFLYFGNYSWSDLYHDLYDKVHGKYFNRVRLEDDPDHFYMGRITVSWDEGDDGVEITLSYHFYPRKYVEGEQPEVEEIVSVKGSTYKKWNWDDLLSTDRIYYGKFTVHEFKRRTLYNPTDRVVGVDAYCSASLYAVMTDRSQVDLPFGPHINAFTIKPGNNVVDFYGDGDIQLDYPLE